MAKKIIEIELDDKKVSDFQTFVERLEGFLNCTVFSYKIEVKEAKKEKK